jgi:hypothetical protein
MPKQPSRPSAARRTGWAAVLVALLLPLSAWSVEDYNNPQIEPLYFAESILPDRLASQYAPIPPNQTWARVRHMGDVGTPQLEQQIANRVFSDRSNKTGLSVPVLPVLGRGFYQRGFEDDPARGTNVYQVVGRSFGWHVNTYQFSHELPIECPPGFEVCGGGPNIAYSRAFDPPLDPWRTPSSEFTLQVYLKLPQVHYDPETPTAGQVSFLYYLVHPETGYLIAGLINLFDTRPFEQVGFERVGSDGITAFVTSDLRDAQPDGTPYRYMNRSPFSSPGANRWRWEEEKFFRAHVSVEQLQAIIDDAGAPGTPDEYRVLEASILIEVFPRITGNLSLGGSLRNFELYRFHDGE